MKKFFIFLLFTTLPLFSLSAEDRIAGTLDHVDLLIEDLYNDDGHNFGERYLVVNRGKKPKRVSIQLNEVENAEDHLVDDPVTVPPHKKLDLGYVVQKDASRGANWKYEWQVLENQDE